MGNYWWTARDWQVPSDRHAGFRYHWDVAVRLGIPS